MPWNRNGWLTAILTGLALGAMVGTGVVYAQTTGKVPANMKTMRVQQQVIINAIVEHNLVQLALAHRLISVPTGRALG